MSKNKVTNCKGFATYGLFYLELGGKVTDTDSSYSNLSSQQGGVYNIVGGNYLQSRNNWNTLTVEDCAFSSI